MMPSLNCENCQNRFFADGPGGGATEVACPDCGGDLQPERDQPGGASSDFRALDMVDSVYQKDMGGNPFGEGILSGGETQFPDNPLQAGEWKNYDGGWQNRMKRDESFASVKSSRAEFMKTASPNLMPVVWDPNEQVAWVGKPNTSHNGILRERYRTQGKETPENLVLGHITLPEKVLTWFGAAAPEGATEAVHAKFLINGVSEENAPEFGQGEALEEPKSTPGVIHNVQPGSGGIHNGPTALLARLPTVKINGVPVTQDTHRDIVSRHGGGGSEYGNPVSVEAYHPAFALLAKKIIEDAHGRPDAYKERVQGIQKMIQEGRIPPPPKVSSVIAPWDHTGHLDQTIHYPWDLDPKQAGPLNVIEDVAEGAKDFAVGDKLDAKDLITIVPGVGVAAKGGKALAMAKKALPAALKKGKGKAAPAVAGGAAARGGKGLLSAAKRYTMIQGGMSLIDKLTGNDEQGGQGPAPLQPQTLQQVTHVHADAKTPTSLDKIPGASENNPEHVDTNEYNDESHSTDPENPNHDEAGGADTGSMAHDALPQILMYYLDDASGENDPMLRELDEALEKEEPGYKNKADNDDDDHADIEEFLKHIFKDGDHKEAAVPMPGSAAVPPRPEQPAGPNPAGGTCPQCASVLSADASCPQCGFGAQQEVTPGMTNQMMTPPIPGVTASTHLADTQGPANPEQFKLVTQALLEMGRQDEIPHMFETPWEYADILAELQNDEIPPPPSVEQPSAPPGPPMGMDPSMMPPPDPSQQIAAAVSRFAADNIAPKCPKCNSHTTGIVSDQGACRCHACGNQWEIKAERSSRTADKYDRAEMHSDADMQAPSEGLPSEVPEQIGTTWAIEDGSALQVGQEYEMHSTGYSVPDIVRIDEIKPDELVFTIQGEFEGLEDQNTISRTEADREGLSFVPAASNTETPTESPEEAMDNGADAPNSQRSETADRFTSGTKQSVIYPYDGEHNTFEHQYEDVKELAKRYHEDFAFGKTEGADWLVEEGMKVGAVDAPWQQPLPDLTGADSSGDADWLVADMPNVKEAGAKFSPQQQREFINENGEARNLDRLDIEDTHYKTRETSVFVAGRGAHRHAQPDMVDDDDFALGF